MSSSGDTPRENLMLTEADLAACRPIVGEGGHVLRALCPFHGSDRQRSLRVQVHSGRFVCFACGAWGYMETATSGGRTSGSARRPSSGLPPARSGSSGSAMQRQLSRQHRALQRRANLPQRGLTWHSSSPPSRPCCRAVAVQPTCSSAACRWRWRSSAAWALQRRAPGHRPNPAAAARPAGPPHP